MIPSLIPTLKNAEKGEGGEVGFGHLEAPIGRAVGCRTPPRAAEFLPGIRFPENSNRQFLGKFPADGG